jgi:hypothetical protein
MYNLSDKNFICKRIRVKNNSKGQLVLWITKNKESPQKYFGIKGDFSLKELLTEDSVENFSTYPIVFFKFYKNYKTPRRFLFIIYWS